jgi:hypothetical protein
MRARRWVINSVMVLSAPLLNGCATSEPSLVPGAESVAVQQVPWPEVEQARTRDAASILHANYRTGKMGSTMPYAGEVGVRNGAVSIGASRVVWGLRMLDPGQPMPADGGSYVAPYGGYYRPYSNSTTNVANSWTSGVSAGNDAARTRAAIDAAQPTYEYLWLYYRE